MRHFHEQAARLSRSRMGWTYPEETVLGTGFRRPLHSTWARVDGQELRGLGTIRLQHVRLPHNGCISVMPLCAWTTVSGDRVAVRGNLHPDGSSEKKNPQSPGFAQAVLPGER